MKLVTNTLVLQILQEEKHMQHENGVTAMFARSSKPNHKDMQKSNVSKSNNTTKSTVQCTNPKCGRPGHTFEQCWAEGGGNEGRKKCQSTTLCIRLCTFPMHRRCISEALLHTLMHCISDSACYATLHCPLHLCLHMCHLCLFVCLFTFVTGAHVACFVCLFPLPDWFH